MPRFGVPYWTHRFPARRRPEYPRQRGRLEVDVAIVGGGFTGCATAYVFASAGARVALFEAGRIGQGATGGTSALLMQEPDVGFLETVDRHGLRAARQIWQMMRRGMLDGVATLRRLNVPCHIEPQDSIALAGTSDQAHRLRREFQARRDAGLDVAWLGARQLRCETGIDGAGGIRVRGNAQIDPYRACLGLAAAAAARGALVFERSPVVKAYGGRRAVEIKTEGGAVRADRIVIATGAPTDLYRPLQRHFEPLETYVVVTAPLGAAMRREVGTRAAMLWDMESPYHYLRWLRDDRIMFGGADRPPTTSRTRQRVLVQRAGQLMYELSRYYPAVSGIPAEYAWSGVCAHTADGVPYIGPHRYYGRHLFALGYAGNGLAPGVLAARVLLRHHREEADAHDDLFGFLR